MHKSETTSKVKPSTSAEALSGTTLAFTPPFTLITLGSALSSAYSLVNSAAKRPFSIFINGNSASGENVIGASFSTA